MLQIPAFYYSVIESNRCIFLFDREYRSSYNSDRKESDRLVSQIMVKTKGGRHVIKV